MKQQKQFLNEIAMKLGKVYTAKDNPPFKVNETSTDTSKTKPLINLSLVKPDGTFDMDKAGQLGLAGYIVYQLRKKKKKNENVENYKSNIVEAINTDVKKLKKGLEGSLKGIRKNNFDISRTLNKIDKGKAKKAMQLYKKYVIEYQIRMHKLLRELI